MAYSRAGWSPAVAIALLTRVPVPSTANAIAPHPAVVVWFPVVGVLVGAVSGAVFAAIASVASSAVAACFAIAGGVMVTGALHEDGLADVCDAMGLGGRPRERVVAILKDPQLGSFGTAALVGSLCVRAVALFEMTPLNGALALLAAHTVGRTALVWCCAFGQPTPEGGSAASLLTGWRWRYSWALLWVPALALIVLGWLGLIAVVASAGIAAASVRVSRKRIGGVVGDVLGAAEQLTEVATLLVAVIAHRYGGRLW